MQPIFLKEAILHRDLLDMKNAKNPFDDEKEEIKEE